MNNVSGRVRVSTIKSGIPVSMQEGANLVLYGWADVTAKLMADNVNMLYFEFENLANPGDPITPPAYDRSGGLAYYTQLASPRDYLRVPITVHPSIISSGDDYQGNQVTFFAVTQGAEGVHGLSFSSSVNSAVFGYALVYAANPDDPTADVVVARTYKDPRPKEPNAQIGIQWTLRFG